MALALALAVTVVVRVILVVRIILIVAVIFIAVAAPVVTIVRVVVVMTNIQQLLFSSATFDCRKVQGCLTRPHATGCESAGRGLESGFF